MKYNLIILFIVLGCSTPKNETIQEPEREPLVEYKEVLIQTDSIFPSDFIKHSLGEWFEYQVSENPNFQIDSFLFSHSIQLIKVPSEFNVGTEFYSMYKDMLSYSPDSLLILDLFSNQVDLKELSNGKYGGFYTISVKGIFWEPAKQRKFFLDIRTEFDAFHDNVWVNDRTVVITGTTKINEPKNFSRIYKIWVLDFEQGNVQIYINPVSCGNYHVDEYIRAVKLRNYETWLDDM
jgi:hypothetical protein